MERVVEPELMDEDEQARAYAGADFAEPHERFVDLLVASAREPLRGTALDLGCGPADVTVRIAKRIPGLAVHGVDGSAAMLKYGRERVAKEKLADRITLVQALLPRDKPPLDRYGVIVSNSLLHHLHDPQALWSTIRRFAAPGAHVFVMDLMRPPARSDVDRFVELYSANEPDVLKRDFHASLCAAFTADEIKAQLRVAGLDALRVDVVSDRHLTVSGAA